MHLGAGAVFRPRGRSSSSQAPSIPEEVATSAQYVPEAVMHPIISTKAPAFRAVNRPLRIVDYLSEQLMRLPVITELKYDVLSSLSPQELDAQMRSRRVHDDLLPSIQPSASFVGREPSTLYHVNDYARKYYAMVYDIIAKLQSAPTPDNSAATTILFDLIMRLKAENVEDDQALNYFTRERVANALQLSIIKINESIKTINSDFSLPAGYISSRFTAPAHQATDFSSENFREEIKELFQEIEKGINIVPNIESVVCEWSRDPHYTVNGKKWDPRILNDRCKAQTGFTFSGSPVHMKKGLCDMLMATQISPFFNALGFSNSRSKFLANCVTQNGFGGIGTAVNALVYTKIVNVNSSYYVRTLPQSIKMAIIGDNQKITLSMKMDLQISSCTSTLSWGRSKEVTKIITTMPIEIKLGLVWLTQSAEFPLIESISINASVEKLTLPGKSAVYLPTLIGEALPTKAEYLYFVKEMGTEMKLLQAKYSVTPEKNVHELLLLAQTELTTITTQYEQKRLEACPPEYALYDERNMGSLAAAYGSHCEALGFDLRSAEEHVKARIPRDASAETRRQALREVTEGFFTRLRELREYTPRWSALNDDAAFRIQLIKEVVHIEKLLVSSGMLALVEIKTFLEDKIKHFEKLLRPPPPSLT